MGNQLELRHLRYFLALSEELHFRKAADRLYVSQPALSRQIKQMEEELGYQLFARHSRKVELTPSGHYLKGELGAVMKHLEVATNHARLISTGQEGTLRLGYIGSAMHEVIPNFLLAIRRKTPNLHFDLKEMNNQDQIEALVRQDIDIGFVRMDRVPEGLNIRPILEETFSLVLPIDHPLTSESFTSLAQLKDEPFILFEPTYSKSYYEKVMQIFDHSGFVPRVDHNTVQATTIYRLIENGFGFAIVPTSLQKGYDMKVKFIELDMIPHRTTLRMIWNAKNQNPLVEMVGVLGEMFD